MHGRLLIGDFVAVHKIAADVMNDAASVAGVEHAAIGASNVRNGTIAGWRRPRGFRFGLMLRRLPR